MKKLLLTLLSLFVATSAFAAPPGPGITADLRVVWGRADSTEVNQTGLWYGKLQTASQDHGTGAPPAGQFEEVDVDMADNHVLLQQMPIGVHYIRLELYYDTDFPVQQGIFVYTSGWVKVTVGAQGNARLVLRPDEVWDNGFDITESLSFDRMWYSEHRTTTYPSGGGAPIVGPWEAHMEFYKDPAAVGSTMIKVEAPTISSGQSDVPGSAIYQKDYRYTIFPEDAVMFWEPYP